MVMQIFDKFKSAYTLLNYYRCQLTRSKSNKIFKVISRIQEEGGDGKVVCDAMWDSPHHWLRLSMFINAIIEAYGKNIIGVYEDTTKKNVIKSLRALPLTGEFKLRTEVDSIYFDKAREILVGASTPLDIINLNLPFEYPAHNFYDGVLKKSWQGRITIDNPELVNQLAVTLSYLEQYNKFFEEEEISAVVLSHPTNIRYGTLVWMALSRDIPVYIINYVNEHITIRKLSHKQDAFIPPVDIPEINDINCLEKVKRNEFINIGKSYLEKVRRGKAGQGVTVGIYDNLENKDYRAQINKILGIDNNKKNIVIMTNCWPDYPNMYGPTYFTDYVHWFEITLNCIRKIDRFNWIIKPHPAEHLYGNNVSARKIVGEPLPEGIYFWPVDMPGNAVESFADLIVSASGSAGIEYPAIGKPVLVARNTPYTPFGFTYFSDSLEEYEELLKNADLLNSLSIKQQEDALIYVGLLLTSHPATRGTYIYKWGALSYKIWPSLPTFIKTNYKSIEKEIRMMKRWVASDSKSYNVFKSLNYELW